MPLPVTAYGIEHEEEAERQRGDLLYYARKTFPNYFAPSAQQIRVFKLWSLLLRAKMKRKWNVEHPDDPVELFPEEQAVVHKIGLSIQSGHGTGKDAFSVIAGLHFLQCFAGSRVMVTAPAGPQLFTVIWPEFSRWIHNSEVLRDIVEINANSVFFKDDPYADHHFIEPRTINPNAPDETKGQVLAGLHGTYILRIIDEASAVPDAVMVPFEGGLTDPVSLIIVIYNPTRTTGFAIETQRRDRDRWLCAHWDAEELREDPPKWVDITQQYELERKYGRDSNFYRIRVRGLPAHESPDTLIAWEWIMDAVEREEHYLPTDPIMFGIDVAGEDGDRTTVAVRRRDTILEIHETHGLNTNHVNWWVEGILLSYLEDDPDLRYYVGIDTINGFGKSLYDYLTEIKHYKSIYEIIVSEKAAMNRNFHRLRDEIWWDVREAFQEGLISIPKDDGLIAELNVIKLDMNREDGLTKIVPKKKMRAELPSGIMSPDKADALMHTQFLRRRFAPAAAMDPLITRRPFHRLRRRHPYGPRSWKTL